MAGNTLEKLAEAKPAERMVSKMFAEVFRAYKEASDEVQAVISEMCDIVNDPETDDDDREAAAMTLMEALFPTTHNGDIGICTDELRTLGLENPKVKPEIEAHEKQEIVFAERLQSIMDEKGVSQSTLAQNIGVNQSAISMMLSRDCRPQRKTIERIAKALGVSPQDLWPNFSS